MKTYFGTLDQPGIYTFDFNLYFNNLLVMVKIPYKYDCKISPKMEYIS